MVALTIGMATHNDFDGVYFTFQATRLNQDVEDTELLVVDNYGCETTIGLWSTGSRIDTSSRQNSPVRQHVPLVSCICLTYNRPPKHQYVVEEAIESLLRQTYPRQALIVFHDCPQQELVCDAPGVRTINAPERIPTQGAKHNVALRESKGELICSWNDDDISLPWRLSLSVERLGDADNFNPRAHLVHESGLGPIQSLNGLHPERQHLSTIGV
jgi:hypothetical protein